MAPIILPEDAFGLLMWPRVVAGRLGWLDCGPQDIWEARYPASSCYGENPTQTNKLSASEFSGIESPASK